MFAIRRTVCRCHHLRRGISNAATAVSQAPLHFLDGQRINPQNPLAGDDFNNLNPATGKVLSVLRESDAADVDRAVSSAKAAFEHWSTTTPAERSLVLRRAADLIKENNEELAKAEVADTGKPIWEARFDMQGCADALDFFSSLAMTLFGQQVPVQNSTFGYTIREPLGVVGCIGAFNFPFQMATWKSGPALACGNTVVFKPSNLTPITSVMLAEVYKEAGLPDGCYNVIQGAIKAGEALSAHPDIAKMTFTGSVQTGSKVMEQCAKDIKKVTLELGGKSPLIIFDDADMENALKGALLANYLTQGQVCSNGTRVYVQRGIYKEFVSRFVERVKAMKIGDPMLDDTTVGAMISEQQAKKVLQFVQTAKEEGGSVLCGGDRVTVPGFEGGWFISPAVVTDVNDNSTIVREEVFGAVASVLPFDTEEEVLVRANDSEFGLAGGVFTNHLARAHRVANRLQAGNIYINNYNAYPAALPFGGNKKSGIGRECGSVCVDYFTQIKTVYVETEDVWCPF